MPAASALRSIMPGTYCLKETFAVIYSNFKSKLHPCSFDLAAAAQALFRLAARNASHFGVRSCHACHFQIKNDDISDLKMELPVFGGIPAC
ncbi:MAG: hypothetical protein LBU06_05625 [Desulfovibrio sp.]|jgi:hypothetical protein|nr:hypothetical protein [Desulfovibrio sp.]